MRTALQPYRDEDGNGLLALPARPFFDRVPLLLHEYRPRGRVPLGKAFAQGVETARLAQRFDHGDTVYKGLVTKTVRFELADALVHEIERLVRHFGVTRQAITVAALHYALTDSFSPAYAAPVRRYVDSLSLS